MWNGATSWATAAGEEGTDPWTNGNKAFFTNATENVIDLEGSTVNVATIDTPNATAEAPVAVTITNGVFNFAEAVNRNGADDASFLKNATLSFGGTTEIHNTNAQNGLGLNRGSHIVFGEGASYIEDDNGMVNLGAGRGPNFIGANVATSNSITICEGASVSLKRHIGIGGTWGTDGTGNIDSAGVLHLKGGSFESSGIMTIGCNLSAPENGMQGPTRGKGFFIQDGGTATVSAVYMGARYENASGGKRYNHKSTSYFTINNGEFICDNFYIYHNLSLNDKSRWLEYNNGQGQILTLNGGTLWVKGAIGFYNDWNDNAHWRIHNSQIYLNGGILKIGGSMQFDDDAAAEGSGGIWCNGGTIKPTASIDTSDGTNTKNFIINEGGLTIDTDEGITFGLYQQTKGGAGALRKTGAGTLKVNKLMMHTGGTVVEEGTLQMNSSSAELSSVTVESGAVLFVPESGTAPVVSDLAFMPEAIFAVNFTSVEDAPVLSIGGELTLPSTEQEPLKVKIAANSDLPFRSVTLPGSYVITSGGKFTADDISSGKVVLDAQAPFWVRSIGVNADGNLCVYTRAPGLSVSVR